jgi:hypothetical protein
MLWLSASSNAQQPEQKIGTANPQSKFGKLLNEYVEAAPLKSSADKQQEKSEEPGGTIQPEAELFLILERLEKLDEPTKTKVLASFQEYLEYRISGYQHRKEVFKWQLYSSKIIFFVVIFLVFVGIYFSGIQFHRSLGPKRAHNARNKGEISMPPATEKDEITKDETTQVVTKEKEEITEIVASVKGIKVSSPILGVIILVVSLLFFYLYLAYVYPIQETI